MSSDQNFKRRATDRPGAKPEPGPRERRSRARRKAGAFDQEIEPMLQHVEPEVREEIRNLVKAGKAAEAKRELLEYLSRKDRAEQVQRIIQKRTARGEWLMHWRVYIFSLIPVLILLYCIFQLLAHGHVEWPSGP